MYGGDRVNDAIMISSILFYMVLHAHDNRQDPLTGLLNRKAFYDDCTKYDRSIKAAASLDMNGLKKMNDTLGHYAGDEALARIAGCIKPYTGREVLAYRVGGDEFVLLFFHAREEDISRMAEQIKESVSGSGYSISAGYALRKQNESVQDTVRESDRWMYADKADYYRINGHDRRKDRENKEQKEPDASERQE